MDSTSPALAFDGFAIDFAGRRLLRDGVEQPLEPKAFGVLALLAGTPGRVFARDEILDAVWGHRHVTPGVLNRVMTLLRHALGEDAQGARYLQTVHGVGYRFDLPEAAPGASAQASAPKASVVEPLSPKRRANDVPRAFTRTLLLLPLLAMIAFAGWKLWSPATPVAPANAVPVAERSIAVLPLVNASNDAQQLYFSDGLSESLINALSRFDGLKVIGRDSAFQFRDGKDDSRTIGSKLGVSYLLGGSVQRAGNVVRINAALTKAADGSTLWAEHYDRPYKDLFALQDEIATAVASALQAKLLSDGNTAKQDDRPPGGNIDAYNAYLQGLKHWHDQNFPEAAKYMTQAVQLDPGYAMAWAHLSGSWSTVATFWNETPALAREHLRIARIATSQALRLAPDMGAAHAARAYLQFYNFDFPGALSECRRAAQLAPNDATVLNGCGYTLAGIGKLDEAIRLRDRLLSIEPLYAVNDSQYAKLLMVAGRLDEAEKYFLASEDLGWPSPEDRLTLAVLRGDARAAQDIAHQMPAGWRDTLALVAQIGPDRTAADKALADVLADKAWVERRGRDVIDNHYRIARIYALRGDAGNTLEWLERSWAGNRANVLFMLADPLILRFRNDPRFIAFCAKIGLPPPSESDALSIDQIRASLAARR